MNVEAISSIVDAGVRVANNQVCDEPTSVSYVHLSTEVPCKHWPCLHKAQVAHARGKGVHDADCCLQEHDAWQGQ